MKTYNIYNKAIKPLWEYLNGDAKKIASALYAEAKQEYNKALEYYNSSIDYYKSHEGYSTYPDKPESKIYYKKAHSYSNMKDALIKFCKECAQFEYTLPWDIVIVAEHALDCLKNFDKTYRALAFQKYYFSLNHYMESYNVAEGLSMEGPLLRKIDSVYYSVNGSEYLNVSSDFCDCILVKVVE